MSQSNKIKIGHSERIDLGKGFTVVITPRTEVYAPPSSSGFTEREIRPTFLLLRFRDSFVTDALLDVIDLIEVLRGFCSNRMISGKEYQIPGQQAGDQLICTTKSKKGNVYLFIYKNEKIKNVLLDKLQCAQLAAKMSKVINSCAYPQPIF